LARIQAAKKQDFVRLDGLETLYKINVRQAIFYIKPPFGTVTGIIYSEDKQSVIIDGKIFHVGDTVQGIKVLKIHRRQVNFEKNGFRWTQKINQTPSSYWE
jgi:hypothetical protein